MVANSYNGILNSNENVWTTATCNNMDKSHKHNVEQKKQVIKLFLYIYYIYIKLKKTAKIIYDDDDD